MMQGLLPIGTVVLLKKSTKRVMIIGVCQKSADAAGSLWDYSGCLFPEGYMGPDKVFLFNHEQIETVYSLGYQDREQMAFKEMADKAIAELRKAGDNTENAEPVSEDNR